MFIWAQMCTAVLIGWDPATPPLPRIWAHIVYVHGAWELLVSLDRRHLFVTPWSYHLYEISPPPPPPPFMLFWWITRHISLNTQDSNRINYASGLIPPYFPGVSMSISAKMAESSWSSMRRSTASTPALPYSLPRRIRVLYSTLLNLPPLRFHCVGGCWGSNPGLLRLWQWHAVRPSYYSARSHDLH